MERLLIWKGVLQIMMLMCGVSAVSSDLRLLQRTTEIDASVPEMHRGDLVRGIGIGTERELRGDQGRGKDTTTVHPDDHVPGTGIGTGDEGGLVHEIEIMIAKGVITAASACTMEIDEMTAAGVIGETTRDGGGTMTMNVATGITAEIGTPQDLGTENVTVRAEIFIENLTDESVTACKGKYEHTALQRAHCTAKSTVYFYFK